VEAAAEFESPGLISRLSQERCSAGAEVVPELDSWRARYASARLARLPSYRLSGVVHAKERSDWVRRTSSWKIVFRPGAEPG
jgi:hypothetical protein